MKPTQKAPAIDALLAAITGKDRQKTIETHGCMTCSATWSDLPSFYAQFHHKDEYQHSLYIKEYRISGMCRKCQDSVFGT